MTTNPASRAPEGTAPTPEFITVGGAMFSREAPEEPRPAAEEIAWLIARLRESQAAFESLAHLVTETPYTRLAWLNGWLASHLPALLADRQRLDWLLDNDYRVAERFGVFRVYEAEGDGVWTHLPHVSGSTPREAIDAARSSSPTTAGRE